VLMKDEVVRILEAERSEMMTKWALTLQSVYRASEAKKEYQATRATYYSLLKPIRQFVARSIVSQSEDRTGSEAEDHLSAKFEAEYKEQEKQEAEERTVKGLEDDYMFQVLDATREAQYKLEKETELNGAKASFDKAMQLFSEKTALVEQQAAELEAKEKEMEQLDPTAIPAEFQRKGPNIVVLDRRNNSDIAGRKKVRAKYRISFRKQH